MLYDNNLPQKKQKNHFAAGKLKKKIFLCSGMLSISLTINRRRRSQTPVKSVFLETSAHFCDEKKRVCAVFSQKASLSTRTAHCRRTVTNISKSFLMSKNVQLSSYTTVFLSIF
jgi:hypothetical protein